MSSGRRASNALPALHTDGLAAQAGDIAEALVIGTLDVEVLGGRERRGEVEHAQALIGDQGAGEGHVVLTGRNRREQPSPRQDVLLDVDVLGFRVGLEVLQQLLVEAFGFAIDDVVERCVVILGGDTQETFALHLGEVGMGAERGREYQRGQTQRAQQAQGCAGHRTLAGLLHGCCSRGLK